MAKGNQGNGQALAAQQVFGPQAAVYATSKVHIRDDSLESVERMVAAGGGRNRYGWTMDLGTGAGFTAFAVAGVSDRVVATDQQTAGSSPSSPEMPDSPVWASTRSSLTRTWCASATACGISPLRRYCGLPARSGSITVAVC